MRFLNSATAVLAGLATAVAGQDWTNNSTRPIGSYPAPWTLHGTVYSLINLPLVKELPAKAYAPLERAAGLAGDAYGRYIGLIGSIQIIRYTDSPVGPYDELLIIPGYFKYPHGPNGEERTNVRVSRIYVSQKYTCKNGREKYVKARNSRCHDKEKRTHARTSARALPRISLSLFPVITPTDPRDLLNSWNIPKHLAKFDWTDNKDGSVTVKVYPYDTTGDETEATPAELPFFQTTFRSLLGQIPFTTELYDFLGVNSTLAQPPLPEGKGVHGELAGTKEWKATIPAQKSSKTTLGTFDMDQGEGDAVKDGKNAVGDEFYPNFWPNMLRYTLGMKMEDATITFSDPEIF